MSARARAAPPPFGVTLAAAAAVSGVVAMWVWLDLAGELWVDNLATPFAAAIACSACVRAAVRHRGRMRLFWALLSCATASWTLAETTWAVYVLVIERTVPTPSWADLGYLLAIPLTIAALIVHPAMRGNVTRKARSTFDGMLVASALLFVSWTLVLGPLWRETNLSTLGGVVTIAYPFADVVMVFFVVLTIRGMSGGGRRSLWCLLAALLAMAVTDSVYTYLAEASSYNTIAGSPIDAGWVAGYLGIALAALYAVPRAALGPRGAQMSRSLLSDAAPLLAVLLALLVIAVQARLGHHLDRTAWVIAVGVVALVLVRQVLVILELFAVRSRRHLATGAPSMSVAIGDALGRGSSEGKR